MSLSIEPRAWPALPSPAPGPSVATEILRLPRRELARAIRDEIERNPLLEEASHTLSQAREDALRDLSSIERFALLEDEAPPGDDGPAEEVMAAEGPDEIDWEDYPNHFLLAPDRGAAAVPDEPDAGLAEAPSLYAHLATQLGLASLSSEEERAASVIVANLDEAGYLRIEGLGGDPLIAVAAEAEVALDVAAASLRKLQRLDPPGVCARDLQECLSLQARARGEDKGLLGLLIAHHLEDVEARGVRTVASALGATAEEARAAEQSLAEMDPKPGLAFAGAPEASPLPDAFIQRAGDGWFASVDDPLAAIRLSRRYRHALRNRRAGSERAIRFLARNLDAALDLLAAVQERQRLVLELARAIASRQRAFLEGGPGTVRPLSIARLSITLGESEEHLRHAAAGKLVGTPHGVFPLSDFFR